MWRQGKPQPTFKPRTWAIAGVGAVGGFYGSRLLKGGADVGFLAGRFAPRWQREGIQVHSPDGDYKIPGHRVYTSPWHFGPVDVLILAAKTTASQQVCEAMGPLACDKTRLVTLQNGMGNAEFLNKFIGGLPVLAGLCFVCAHRDDEGVIHHHSHGKVVIGQYGGPPGENAKWIAQALKAGGVDVEIADDLDSALWRKLLWNIPFNGLAITLGGKNCAEILSSPEGEKKVRTLMDEVMAAAEASGHPLPDDLPEKLIRTTRKMGPYKPSTLLDFLHGRELEIEAIWREPIRRAAAAGAPMPATQRLTAELEKAAAGQ